MDEVKPVARMPTVEHREPCESRGSRTVLGAPGGEIPPGDSTNPEKLRSSTSFPVCPQQRTFVSASGGSVQRANIERMLDHRRFVPRNPT